MDVLWM